MRKFLAVNKWLALVGLCVAMSTVVRAQTITTSPTNSTIQVSVGAQALGLGTAAAGTDAVAKVSVISGLSLRSDNILVPTAQFQMYTGGFQYNLPTSFLSKTNLSSLQLYATASVGADRITSGSGQSHVGFLAGGGANWLMANNVIVNIVEVRFMHAPGYSGGSNVPVVSGGISLFF